MPRKIKSYGRQDLIDVALPNHADSYTVISHKSVMDLSTEALEDAGFQIENESYRATRDGNIASAVYKLTYGDDPELSMMFAWSNSYNKQMRFKCGVGALMDATNNTMVCGDMGSWARKHTGTADTETEETIKEQVKLAEMYYNQLVSDKNRMKEITLDKRKQAQLLGILFADHEILTTEQASLIRQNMNRPFTQFLSTVPGQADNSSLWAFYNYVTLALQQSHPKTWMEDQRILHWFISDTFKFDKVEVKEEEVIDPNQVDLEDSIAEVEAEAAELVVDPIEDPIADERKAEWDEQTRLEEGFDHKGGLTDDELAADEEMQEMKTEEVIEEKEKEDSIKIHIESDEEYEKRVAKIEGEIAEDEAAVAEVCDEEAKELIAGQETVDKLDAEDAVSDENIDDTVKGPDFDLDFVPVAEEDKKDVDSDDVDFDFA